ncbi:hypothetical protein CPSG_07377 [Coccidioides posadasii str. Silveira]|uniref:Uncharacterized protein n=1 Tax=Coccidioides posadasii (strain RMSCC 757 / Silveira) TaxID=443226 RepID=E9DC25_COCPS|nr:hypothetical protein CPSG_07377 [Coccidioides posadasii str. Silveira]
MLGNETHLNLLVTDVVTDLVAHFYRYVERSRDWQHVTQILEFKAAITNISSTLKKRITDCWTFELTTSSNLHLTGPNL